MQAHRARLTRRRKNSGMAVGAAFQTSPLQTLLLAEVPIALTCQTASAIAGGLLAAARCPRQRAAAVISIFARSKMRMTGMHSARSGCSLRRARLHAWKRGPSPPNALLSLCALGDDDPARVAGEGSMIMGSILELRALRLWPECHRSGTRRTRLA